MTTLNELGDKALAIFCFALYHQLTSGDEVTGVIAQDEAGHKADADGVAELVRLDLATLTNGFITFTPAGLTLLQQLTGRVRGA